MDGTGLPNRHRQAGSEGYPYSSGFSITVCIVCHEGCAHEGENVEIMGTDL